jgi:zinc transport system permease protein
MLILNLFIVGIVGWFYNDFLALSYDEEFAKVRGVPIRLLYFLLMAMIALSVVMTIRVVGLILVIALLTIPPYIAEKYSRSLSGMMIISVILGIGFTLTGLWLSYIFNLTSGAMIIMVGATGFFISAVTDRLRK